MTEKNFLTLIDTLEPNKLLPVLKKRNKRAEFKMSNVDDYLVFFIDIHITKCFLFLFLTEFVRSFSKKAN